MNSRTSYSEYSYILQRKWLKIDSTVYYFCIVFMPPAWKVRRGESSNWIVRPSVCLFVCLSVRSSDRNSVPLTNKVQYLKFGWWCNNQTWPVSSSMGSVYISTTCWVSLLVDQWVPEGTCSQVLRSTSSFLRLIRSVLRASKFFVLKLTEIVILWVYYTIPFGFSLFWHFSGINFQLWKLLCLTKDHWRGFSTRNAHMVHNVN